MRRIIGLLLSISMIFLSGPALATPWTFELTFPLNGRHAFEITENYSFGLASAVKLAQFESKDFTLVSSCQALGVSPCFESLLGSAFDRSKAEYPGAQLEFSIVVPVCDGTNLDLCIEGLDIYSQLGPATKANFLRSVNGNTTPKIASHNIPAGGTVSLWEGAAGSGREGLKLAAYALLDFTPRLDPRTNSVSYAVNGFSMEVRAFEFSSQASDPLKLNESLPGSGLGSFSSPMPGCAWQDDTGCGKWVDLPVDVRIGVTLRTAYKISNFLNGRLKDPRVSNVKDGNVTVLKVDAIPVTVPQLGITFGDSDELLGPLDLKPGSNKTLPYYPNAFKAMNVLRDFAKDRASGENTIWRISAMGGENRCYEGVEVAGLVVTNATAYEGAPPALVDGYLEYKVAGMHYLSDGATVFEGTYDLAIQSDVARCLYGYSKAPISATVTVVGISGEQKVASKQVVEEGGWLKLSAYGFSFSENKILAKITGTKSSSQSGLNPAEGAPVGPVSSQTTVFKSSLPPFGKNSTSLSKTQLNMIKRLVKPTAKTVTCTAAFAEAKEASLARRQAQSVCAAARKISKKAKVISRIIQLPIPQAGLVEIRTT